MTHSYLKTNLWKFWLVGASVISIVFAYMMHVKHLWGPHSLIGEKIFLDLPAQTLALFAILTGAFMHLRTHKERLPWYILFAALFFGSYGWAEIYFNFKSLFGYPAPFPSISTWIDMLFYILFAFALLMFDHRRYPERSIQGAIDGSVLAFFCVIVSIFLAPEPPGGATNIGLIFPALDLFMLGAVIRLAIGKSVLDLPIAFLIISVILYSLGDTVSGFLLLQKSEIPFNLADQFFSFAAIFLGAAALHPDMVYLGRLRSKDTSDYRKVPVRAIVIALIAIAPMILFAAVLRIWVPWAYGLAIVSMILYVET